ncbi:Hypothetical predicted protein [Paramuricea clavata]|uniref:Uncharacterized protein n=1 Tax=Paramuricea clavata TaxID=317549 RepID=A0A7D9IRZ5_PARCT|nr:Hypothetical predicted protein [Paramuricea clavata]
MKEKAVFAKMLINDVHVFFQVDCGASANILPCNYVEKEKISPCDRTLVMWNGTKVKSLGTFEDHRGDGLLTIHKENFISTVFCKKMEVVDKHAEVFNDDISGKIARNSPSRSRPKSQTSRTTGTENPRGSERPIQSRVTTIRETWESSHLSKN